MQKLIEELSPMVKKNQNVVEKPFEESFLWDLNFFPTVIRLNLFRMKRLLRLRILLPVNLFICGTYDIENIGATHFSVCLPI